MQAKDGRKRPREVLNYVVVNDGDDDVEVLEVSPLRDMHSIGSSPLQQHEGLVQHPLIVGPSPLGLRLTKSPSFVKMIEMKLNQGSRAKETTHGVLNTESITKPIPKASKFHASTLQIGAWEWKSRYAGDLVAKFYYTYRKLVWEILYEGLKRKIEIEWKYISALKVTSPEGGPGTLEIVICPTGRPFGEKPTKSPGSILIGCKLWTLLVGKPAFTVKQVLRCSPGLMNKHIEKLLSDSYLYSLSQKNTIHQENPFFEECHAMPEVPESSTVQSFNPLYDYYPFGQQQFGESIPIPIGTNTAARNYIGSQNGMSTLLPSSAPSLASVITGADSTPGGPGLQMGMLNCNNTPLQAPPQAQDLNISNTRIMRDTPNYTITNPRNQRNLLGSVGTGPGSLIRPEEVRSFINDVRRSGKRPVAPWSAPFYSNGASWPTDNTMEVPPPTTHHDFNFNNGSSSSSLVQLGSVMMSAAGNVGTTSSAAMAALEKLSHDLLGDNADAAAQDDEVVMSAVNSLAGLLGQQQDPDTAHSSQASSNSQHAGDAVVAAAAAAAPAPLAVVDAEEATDNVQLDDAAAAGGGEGGGLAVDDDFYKLMSPVVESGACEEPMGEIEMDMEYLSQLLPFCP
ncbi:hypothetical protein ACP4OV_027955 [Aristida adscensionis]